MDHDNWTFEYGLVYMSDRCAWVRSFFRGTVDQVSEQARLAMLSHARDGRMIAVRLYDLGERK